MSILGGCDCTCDRCQGVEWPSPPPISKNKRRKQRRWMNNRVRNLAVAARNAMDGRIIAVLDEGTPNGS